MHRQFAVPYQSLFLAAALQGCALGSTSESDTDTEAASEVASEALDSDAASVEVDATQRVIRIRRGVREIAAPPLQTDRPELSPGGDRVVYSVEEVTPAPFFILSALEVKRSAAGRWSSPRLIKQGIGVAVSGELQSWFEPTYRPSDDGFLIGLGSVQTDASGAPNFATLQSTYFDLNQRGAIVNTLFTASQLGFPFGEIPQGQHYSPDGTQIVFFAQQPQIQGLYLYTVASKALTRLTTTWDKDPSFSADGKNVYFFSQVGDRTQGTAETDTLARLTLRDRTGVITATRTDLPAAPEFVQVEAHPTSVVGSDVLLLHAEREAGAPFGLAARRSCPLSRRFELSIEVDGKPLVEAQRIATALYTHDAAFMGRFEGDVHDRIFAMSSNVVERVTNLVAASKCPRP